MAIARPDLVPHPTSGAFAALRDAIDGFDRFRWLLLLRFGILNLAGLALLAVVWRIGWLDPIVATDSTHICALIFGLFVLGTIRSGERAWTLSRELNSLARARAGDGSKAGEFLESIRGADSTARATLASALKLKLVQRLGGIRYIASSLVLLGLIGTVVGFIMALGGVDERSAADVSAIGPMVSTLIEGMSVALYTTLVGSVLNIWLMLNYRLLEGAAVHLLTGLVELGERHARV
ncbi:MAG: MotA/TolQ/ExbB proton channel family protein [Geminicoccaceae bacterium]